MPTLPIYTSQSQPAGISGGRRASGEDFAAPIGDFSKAVAGAADRYLTDKEDAEARKVVVASSEIRAKYAKLLDQAATSGGDLSALRQQMSDELTTVGDGFETRRGTESLAIATANTGMMFDEQTNAIEVRRAASTARLDGAKLVNSASAIIQSNPLYLGEAEKNTDAFVDSFSRVSPEMKAELKQKFRNDLNAAAVAANARIDPEGTLKALQGGAYDLEPSQRNQGINLAESEIHAKRADESYQRSVKEYEERERDEKSRDTHFKDIIAGKASRRQIMDDPSLRPATREHLITFMEERAKSLTTQDKRSDPTVVRDLWMRIHAPDTDPKKIFNGDAIFEAVSSGKVNVSDANQLNTLVANQKDENNRTIGSKLQSQMSVVGRALSQDPKFIGQPAMVAEIQNNYQARVFDKVSQLRDAKQDPNDVFNPGSKNYVGSREFIQGAIDEAQGRARAAAADKIPRPSTQAEYDALPNGSVYVDTDGATKTKKSGRTAAGKIGGL